MSTSRIRTFSRQGSSRSLGFRSRGNGVSRLSKSRTAGFEIAAANQNQRQSATLFLPKASFRAMRSSRPVRGRQMPPGDPGHVSLCLIGPEHTPNLLGACASQSPDPLSLSLRGRPRRMHQSRGQPRESSARTLRMACQGLSVHEKGAPCERPTAAQRRLGPLRAWVVY